MTVYVCEEGVTRSGELQPCDKVAVAVRNDPEGPYPVCAFHTRGDMEPLEDLMAAAWEQGREHGYGQGVNLDNAPEDNPYRGEPT